MDRYDYLTAVKDDVLDFIEEGINFSDFDSLYELAEKLNDDCFLSDSVTGNASGSYYYSTWKAEEALSHNWLLLAEALEEFGYDGLSFKELDPERLDVIIRCYVLAEAISLALDEIKGAFNAAHAESEEE